MFKKNTISALVIVVFSVLILAPYFMINCTEPDGNSRIENVFNRCCPSSMHGMHHHPINDKETTVSKSHCKCSVNFSSEEYITPHSDKFSTNKDLHTYNSVFNGKIIQERNFLSYKSESPPLSLDLVISTVLLI